MTLSNYAKLYLGAKQGGSKHKYIVDQYNLIKPLPRGYKVKYSDNWCATFVSFVLKMCNTKINIYECGAERMRDKCIDQELLIKDTTKGKKNDIIFYDWNSDKWCDHVGIIQRVAGDNYYVIEGNKNKQVGVRVISKKSKSIQSIARIK